MIDILVINWNQASRTIRCLEALQCLDALTAGSPDYRVHLLDNGSVDESFALLEGWFAGQGIALADKGERSPVWPVGVSLLSTVENVGYAAGMNLLLDRVAQEGDGSRVLFLNNDAIIEPGAVAVLSRVMDLSKAAAVSGVIVTAAGSLQFAGERWPWTLIEAHFARQEPGAEEYWETSRYNGAGALLDWSLLARRKTDAGYYFDPTLFMYFDELDLSRYAASLGLRCVVARDAIVRHDESSSAGGRASSIVLYYLTRNRILMAKRLLRPPALYAYYVYFGLRTVVQELKRLLQRQGMAITRAAFSGLLTDMLLASVSGRIIPRR